VIRAVKIFQLLVSLSVVGLFWLIYPGIMVLIASAVALLYVAAAVGALRGHYAAGRVAFVGSLATAILATVAVLRFVGNGFSYRLGNFELHDGVYWPPYAFLAIAIGASLVVSLQLLPARKRRNKPQS
jgi:hypothetical protein